MIVCDVYSIKAFQIKFFFVGNASKHHFSKTDFIFVTQVLHPDPNPLHPFDHGHYPPEYGFLVFFVHVATGHCVSLRVLINPQVKLLHAGHLSRWHRFHYIEVFLHRQLYPALLAQRVYHNLVKLLAIFKKSNETSYWCWYPQALDKDLVET